jgi:hypothetical protein
MHGRGILLLPRRAVHSALRHTLPKFVRVQVMRAGVMLVPRSLGI